MLFRRNVRDSIWDYVVANEADKMCAHRRKCFALAEPPLQLNFCRPTWLHLGMLLKIINCALK